MRPLNQVAKWYDVDQDVFKRDIQPLAQPAILKGLVANWPAVDAAKRSDTALFDYLSADYKGGDARFISQDAEQDGYYFYSSDYTGFNFTRKIAGLNTILRLIEQRKIDKQADRIAMQSAPVDDYFHSFSQQNVCRVLTETVKPRFWLGTDGLVNTHYDDAENIACVIAGHRQFTLFPPEQISNLYIGPLENTPGGAAVSLTKLENPDFVRFPKLKNALNYALQANLEPGDAIYIPALWWHHVKASSAVNMLVNYWQSGSIGGLTHPSGLDAVLMGLVSLAKLPRVERQSWLAIFNYLVMSEREEFDYMPEHLQGILSGSDKASEAKVYQWLKTILEKMN